MEYIWTTREGKKINVDDMDINHLRNSLKMCMRNMERARKILKEIANQKTKPKFQIHGEMAQEHADAYEVYKNTGVDILGDDYDELFNY